MMSRSIRTVRTSRRKRPSASRSAVVRAPAGPLGYQSPTTFERRWATEGGTTPVTGAPALPGGAAAKARAAEALTATRRRGAAISVSPPAPSATLISRIPGILEAAPPTPVGTRAACLLTP